LEEGIGDWGLGIGKTPDRTIARRGSTSNP